MKDRTIFHVDVNSAFLSWEAVYRLHHLGGTKDLRTCAAAVAGDTAMRHGIILAKSLPAAKYGVKTGESIFEARQKCPKLLLVPPNYRLYQKCSEAFLQILGQYTPQVEPYSIDEAFLDLTGTMHRWESPEQTAGRIQKEIRDKLGFTVNIGISRNKLLAKMASDFEKPGKIHTLYPDEIREKMWPLPVESLFFSGASASGRLRAMGISTIGELAGTDPAILKASLKKQGETLWAFANGIESSPVEAEAVPNKGYGNSTTVPEDIRDPGTARLVLLSLCETLGTRLREAGCQAGTVSVTLRDFLFRTRSRQRRLEEPTSLTSGLYRQACVLLEELWDGEPLRHLGIHTSKISGETGFYQMRLFEKNDPEKTARMERTADAIRKKYGRDAVFRAAFLGGCLDHMAGGISREKWEPDYEREGVM